MMPAKPPAVPRSFVLQKTGPLPNWAWGAIGLVAAVAISSYRRNRAAATDPTAPSGSSVSAPLGNQTAPFVFVSDYGPLNVPVNVTVPQAPPGGGRDAPPGPAGPAGPPGPVGPVGPPVVTPPAVTPPPVAAGPSYTAVRVSRFNENNPAWDSTVWGIAEHYGYGGANWGTVWNDPKNSNERIKAHLNPRLIQPGDTIYVRNR